VGLLIYFLRIVRRKVNRGRRDIERSKIAGLYDEYETVFQRGASEMLWICMNDTYIMHIRLIVRIITIVDHQISF
jgi:hypothetical protein